MLRPGCVDFLCSFESLLRSFLQVEYSLHPDHAALEFVHAEKEVFEPVGVERPGEKHAESDTADLSFVHHTCQDSAQRDELGAIGHAKVKPDPAAVVGDEHSRCLIEHFVLAGHYLVLLVEGSNDVGSS